MSVKMYRVVQCGSNLHLIILTGPARIVDCRHPEGNAIDLQRGVHDVVVRQVDNSEDVVDAARSNLHWWNDLSDGGCDSGGGCICFVFGRSASSQGFSKNIPLLMTGNR